MEAFETYERAGCKVSLFQDYDAGNPYKEWDQPSEILVGSAVARQYDLGAPMPHPESAYDDDPSSEVMCRYLTLFGGYVLALPFTFQDYGSSGSRVWITTPDDEPASGYVVMSAKERDAIGVSIGDEEKAARADFEPFRAWIEGEVCGFVVESPDGEIVDSCWGFYGLSELDYVREQANEAADDWNRERLLDQEPTDVAEILADVR